MLYKMFDAAKLKFIGESKTKKKSKHIVYIPQVDFMENNATFMQFFNKFKTAIEETNYEDIESCHKNYPKFMDIWRNALLEII